jgi:hypothetical protein
MSGPVAHPNNAIRGSVSRRVRGYVESYGRGRTCETSGCDTTLSQYNKATLCWRHAEDRTRAALRNDR